MILLDGDTGRNIYQLRKGLQDFLVLTINKRKMQEAFPEVNTKVRSHKRLRANKQTGKRSYKLKQGLVDMVPPGE